MRKFTILPAVAAFAILASSAAMADGRTTASATLVDPNTQAYVGTFVESCSSVNPKFSSHPNLQVWPYVGVYLGKAFDLQGAQFLSLTMETKAVFTTSPRANGEETIAYEIGGVSQNGCIADGTKIDLVYGFRGMNLPLIVIGTGTVQKI